MSSICKKSVVVVIPIYSDHPSKNEVISISQAFQILQNRIIRILHPVGMDISAYQSIVPTGINSKNTIEFISFPSIHFIDIRSYNTWLLTPGFYENFIDFEFLCIVQTDVFLFSDDLNYWLNQNWDYIGAPWFEGWGKGNSTKFIGAGNGGFSLRRIKPIIRVLNSRKKLSSHKQSIKRLLYSKNKKAVWNDLKHHNSTHYSKIPSINNEDRWFAQLIPTYFPDFQVAPPKVALKFSIEVNPRFLVQLNDGKLPMGCHAWWKYDPEFLFPIVKSFNHHPV
ncbi:hypothetical protein N8891_06150 [Flavobacteriales bacterium]|nr:hypothetical protein [Flavobacteriales bacterium]